MRYTEFKEMHNNGCFEVAENIFLASLKRIELLNSDNARHKAYAELRTAIFELATGNYYINKAKELYRLGWDLRQFFNAYEAI